MIPVACDLFDLSGVEGAARLQSLHWQFRASRLLHVAVRLEVFDRLHGRTLSAEELAKELGTRPEMTKKLLVALCAMQLVERRGDRFGNTEEADRFLVSSSPLYQGHIIRFSATRVWNFWDGLEAALLASPEETGDRPGPQPASDAEVHRDFILGMHNLAVTGAAQQVTESVDLSKVRRLLDLGGGPGTYSIAFCQRYPHLEAVILDLPETLQWTEKVVASFGLQDRIHLQPGSWDDDTYGEGFDAALLSMILHGPDSGAPMKLQKTFRALRPGGLLMAQEFQLNDDKTGPLGAALFQLMVGAYSESEFLDVIRETGFEDVRIAFRGDRDNALVVARKPLTA